MKYLFSVLLSCLFVNIAIASVSDAVNVGNIVASVGATDSDKLQTIAILENDLTILDSEILKCEKSKKGWIAATVVGSAGVVATGVAAGVQGAKIAEKKKELLEHNAEINKRKDELQSLQPDNE
jgi:hypothetical protein